MNGCKHEFGIKKPDWDDDPYYRVLYCKKECGVEFGLDGALGIIHALEDDLRQARKVIAYYEMNTNVLTKAGARALERELKEQSND